MTSVAPDQPAARAAGQQGGQLLFILAPARSFSTVSAALLDGHPGIFSFPEMLLFTASTVGELIDSKRIPANTQPRFASARMSGIYRAVAALHEGCQSDEAVGRAVSWLERRCGWATTHLMDHLREISGARICVEKTPETIATDRALAACMKAYSDARYIHLTRHPVDTQRSMQQNHQQTLRQPLSGKALVATCASAWYLGHTRVVRALDGLPEDRWIRVRGEDLLREPRIWLPRILDWLGLAWDDTIITRMLRTELWQFSGTGPSDRLLGGDPSYIRAPALRPVAAPGPVTFDPSWGLPSEMRRRMTVLARNLGY
jgi:hypothetical protein